MGEKRGLAVEIITIKRVDKYIEELSDLLIKVVHGGASIGFLPPLKKDVSDAFWRSCVTPDIIFIAAKVDNKIAGTVQLHLCTKPNGTHRAEVAKLMVHPNFRLQGIARQLMNEIENRAKQEERSLLVLDTREGDSANVLYQSLGFIEAGRIPNFAQSETGNLDTTILYYKTI
ncbi:GNAT family N-acetyltransferase [Fictibacillus phosphorivorans]|uniref:GNAT family N-acetyltransferase n=1 Tax=Fictibacillus phosphorivorans TaxID=1221500 RepID=UPI00203E5C84|nr:GNAT family N-acetyltransferase [Fictibacillus phosphorivorans]MCM3720300.1 GNAT family N-acetyltransferase [Fictibacillus phosphorivorans]MCM3777990.1 GNAT family N-acetyltransferase [Fictibacillus phosphorivorans]